MHTPKIKCNSSISIVVVRNVNSISGFCRAFILCFILIPINGAMADVASATQEMEDATNPLLRLTSSRGSMFIELFPNEAPENVERFLALAAGEVEFFDALSNRNYAPRYFDGMRFHRVVPGFVIQGGSPNYHPLGMPDELLDDEINANALGLDRLPVLAEDGSVNPILNVQTQKDFGERVLTPLYDELNIDSLDEVDSRQSDITTALQSLTVMRLYEYEGFDYQNQFPTRGISRGTVALANDGPNRNGPEFFIALTDSEWLNGRYTVIGRVVEGMEVADDIGTTAIDPTEFNPSSPYIYSLRRAN